MSKKKDLDCTTARKKGAEIVEAKKAREENAIKFQKEIDDYR